MFKNNSRNLAPDGSGGTPESTGDIIGKDIQAVNAILGPILATAAPGIGNGISLALKIVSVAEPAAWNAIATLIQGGDLTEEQNAAIEAIEQKLQDPDSYLKQ